MTARLSKRPHPLEVLFLTNYSDSCFRAIPGIAQMADEVQLRLTLLHAYNPRKINHGAAEATLRSFFPEADRYANTCRVAMPGSAFDVVRRITQDREFHMVICPGSDQLGLPRPGHRSLRGRILREIGIPVWTLGRRTESARLTRRARNIGCWVEHDDALLTHLAFAAEYAAEVQAKLHLFYSLPDIHEGIILPPLPERPLHESLADKFFAKQLRDVDVEAEVHVTTQRGTRARAKHAARYDVDLMFTAASVSPLAPWLFASLSAADQLPCPMICVASKSGRVWSPAAGSAIAPVRHAFQQPEPAVLAFARR